MSRCSSFVNCNFATADTNLVIPDRRAPALEPFSKFVLPITGAQCDDATGTPAAAASDCELPGNGIPTTAAAPGFSAFEPGDMYGAGDLSTCLVPIRFSLSDPAA